jgi:hypothetical protein
LSNVLIEAGLEEYFMLNNMSKIIFNNKFYNLIV